MSQMILRISQKVMYNKTYEESSNDVLALSFQCISEEQHVVTVVKRDSSSVVLQNHEFVDYKCKHCSYIPGAQVTLK